MIITGRWEWLTGGRRKEDQMYLTAYVLGPKVEAEYSVSHYEALRQRETAQVAERRAAIKPATGRSDVRGWFGNLIPALQR
jgi:hypothetical protein